jgi:hypothetical protein
MIDDKTMCNEIIETYVWKGKMIYVNPEMLDDMEIKTDKGFFKLHDKVCRIAGKAKDFGYKGITEDYLACRVMEREALNES